MNPLKLHSPSALLVVVLTALVGCVSVTGTPATPLSLLYRPSGAVSLYTTPANVVVLSTLNAYPAL